jgi:general secretion pathway protein L
MSIFRVEQMMDWQSRIEPATRGALRWWLGELRGLVPQALRRRLAGLKSRLVLVADASGTALLCETGEEREPLGRVDLREPQTVRRALSAAPQGRLDRAGHVTLRLPPDRALRTRVALPLAAERNLDQVVGFEFERLVPFKRDEAYYAYRVVARDKATRNLQVELTVAPRGDIDATAQAAARAGLHLAALEIMGAAPLDPGSIIPLRQGDGTAARSQARIAVAVLAATAALLATACIAIPFWRAHSALDALTVQVAEARRQAEASLALQKQIDAQLQDQRFLIDRRLRMPTVTELLDTITRLTPDNTWLTELQIDGSEVHLIGASVSATALLGLVDQSPAFRNAAFRSSITQDSQLKRERFDISARIAPREGK